MNGITKSGSELISELLANEAYKIVISNPSVRAEYRKITLSLYDKGYLCEQLSSDKAYHQTIGRERAAEFILAALKDYSQLNAWDDSYEYAIRITKKNKLLIQKKACAHAPARIEGHNREKSSILKEGSVAPPLVDMGVITPQGRVVQSMYDKFRQINRFLEIIDDLIREQAISALNIVDFGCGKSYLTFIVYYYLTQIRNISVNMTGVDLKQDVIDYCNRLSAKYQYEGLRFVCGDIADFERESQPVDMVISLHACDTATDYALFNAIRWGAKFILSAPCCHHEAAKQISFTDMPIFGEYGVIHERASALITDAIRGRILHACGYKTQIMEFVDLCHTPKNLLIRSQKANIAEAGRKKAAMEVEEFCRRFGLEPKLYVLAKGFIAR